MMEEGITNRDRSSQERVDEGGKAVRKERQTQRLQESEKREEMKQQNPT